MTCVDCARFPETLDALVGWRHVHEEEAPPCWWFVREVYRRHLGRVLPAENALEPRRRWRELIDAARQRYVAVEVPEPYDLLLLRWGRIDHIGLFSAPGVMVHMMNPDAGVCRSRLDDWTARGWAPAAYRWTASN